jgi:hypothetical protein
MTWCGSRLVYLMLLVYSGPEAQISTVHLLARIHTYMSSQRKGLSPSLSYATSKLGPEAQISTVRLLPVARIHTYMSSQRKDDCYSYFFTNNIKNI